MAGEMGFDGGGEIVEGVAMLLTAGFYHREHGLHEAAAGGALGAEGELSPDHRVTQRSLTRVVGRFNAFTADERPEPITMLVQFPTHADQRDDNRPSTAR